MSKGRIINAQLVLPDQVMRDHDVLITNGVITAISQPGLDQTFDWTVDAAGDWLIPGLIDLHVHGAGGCDSMDGSPASLATMSRTLLAQGTVAFPGHDHVKSAR